MQVILALRQLGPDCEFKASFSYTVRPWGGGAETERERERERESKNMNEIVHTYTCQPWVPLP
jgi:hypothetical protein